MTNEELIAKIKGEIETRIIYAIGFRYNVEQEERASFFNGEAVALKHLLSFLSTLEEQTKGSYDESYIQSKIAKASKTWKGVDVDEYLSQVRGEVHNSIFDECVAKVDQKVREEVRRNIELEEEINRYIHEECFNDDDEPGIHEIAEHFAQWGDEHLKK